MAGRRFAVGLCMACLLVIGFVANPGGAQTVVTPGAFCSPQGARGVTTTGLAMVCTTTATDSRARWRQAGPSTPDPTTPPTTTPPATSPPVLTGEQTFCHSSYVDACVPPFAGDVDCPDGTGDGPTYAPSNNFTVVGPDIFDLDRDNDGIACETREGDTSADLTDSAATGQPVVRQASVAETGRRPLARTGQTSGRQVQLALAFVLLGTALVIAPGALLVQKKRLE